MENEQSQSRTIAHGDEWNEIQELRQRIQGLQTEFEQADRRLREVARERPFVAIAGAVIAGFLLGRIISRV